MPQGKPTAEQLMSGKVAGFSIDTCIFESLGFRLSTGELGVLRQQLPPWLKLFISSIVYREIVGHQVNNVRKVEQELNNSIKNIYRHTEIEMKDVSAAVGKLGLEKVASVFESRLDKFIHKFSGRQIKEKGDKLIQEMFDRYFKAEPPFELIKDKKSEFPDAASLLALEQHAKEKKKIYIVVSNDGGWERFCDASDSLFCVKKLEDLTALYQADSEISSAIEDKLVDLLNDPASPVNEVIESALDEGVPNCSWIVEAHTGYTARVEPEVDRAEFESYSPEVDSIRLWYSKNGEEICVVELDVEVTIGFDVSADFSTWDSIDSEYVGVGSGRSSFSESVKMTIYLTLSGDLSDGEYDDWNVEVELSQQDYWIDAGEMEPDYGDYDG